MSKKHDFDIPEEFSEKSKNHVRTRAMRRHNNVHKALRKKRISDTYFIGFDPEHHYYNNLHQYSKNKIHCSCPLCRAKTNNKGRTGSIEPLYNPKISQKRKEIAMHDKYLEYINEDKTSEN